MQTQSSDKVSHGCYTSRQSSRESTLKEARSVVENALILNPTMPAAQLAHLLFQHSASELAESLNAVLAQEFYAHTIRAMRRKQATADRLQFALPGCEHLPLKIPGPKGMPIRLLDANVSTIKEYYWSLMRKYSDRKRSDPKIKETKALLEKMQAASETEKRITVRQVLLLEEL
jgi:hypothetical protein